MHDNLAAALESWLSCPSVTLFLVPAEKVKALERDVEVLQTRCAQLEAKYITEVEINLKLTDLLRKAGYNGQVV